MSCLAVWFQPGAKLSFQKQSMTHTDIYPFLSQHFLASAPSSRFFILFNGSPQFQWEGHRGGSCLGSAAIDWICWLEKQTKKVSEISRNGKHKNRLVGKKNPPLSRKLSKLRVRCWYGCPMRRFRSPNPSSNRPQKKKKKDLFEFFASELERGGKKTGNKQGF